MSTEINMDMQSVEKLKKGKDLVTRIQKKWKDMSNDVRKRFNELANATDVGPLLKAIESLLPAVEKNKDLMSLATELKNIKTKSLLKIED